MKIFVLFIIILFFLVNCGGYLGRRNIGSGIKFGLKYTEVGNGSEENPFIISTANQMYDLSDPSSSEDWDKHFKIVKDIDFSEVWSENIGIGSPINPFTGSFDGQNHTIKSFSYISTDDRIGLFRETDGASGQIHCCILPYSPANINKAVLS